VSNFAIRALAYSITPELERAGVSVTIVCSGFVASNIRKVDNLGRFHSDRSDYDRSWQSSGCDRAARGLDPAEHSVAAARG